MAEIETLAAGFGLIEGPTWDGSGLLFSDVFNGGVHRLDPGTGAVQVVVPKRRGVGGIVLHADGGVVVSGRNIQHVTPDGGQRILHEDPTAGGWNDLTADAEGRVYIGSLRRDPFAEGAGRPGECYRIELDGAVTELYGDVGLTNGIGFSPDGATMYHSDSVAGHVIVHDLEDGVVANRRAIEVTGTPDGLAVDTGGRVWVACADGGKVRAYDPDGAVAEEVRMPQRFIASVCFGGPDLTDLYVVSGPDDDGSDGDSGRVYRVTGLGITGLAVPPARV